MTNDSIKIINLESHETKDTSSNQINGNLTVVWRDWDQILPESPKMIYLTCVNPNETKGPHLHTKRTSYFTCIHGRVIFVIREKNGNYVEIESSSEKPVMVIVPKNIASGHVNLSDNVSRVLTLADISWKPNDDEMKNVIFENYDWEKWKKNNFES